MVMITPEVAKDTCMGFNTFHTTKTLYIRFLSASVWWLGNLNCELMLVMLHQLEVL